MKKYLNEKGEVGIMYSKTYAFATLEDPENYRHRNRRSITEYSERYIYDPELISILLEYKKETDKVHKRKLNKTFIKACADKNIDLGLMLAEHPDSDKYPDSHACYWVDIAWLKSGTPFVIVSSSDFDDHSLGGETIITDILVVPEKDD